MAGWWSLLIAPHPPLEPISGNPDAVRAGARQYMQAAAEIGEAVEDVGRLVVLLQSQSGELATAVIELMQMLMVRGTRLAGVWQDAGRGLDEYGQELAEGQRISVEASAADEAAHREFEQLCEQMDELQAMVYGSSADWRVTSDIDDLRARLHAVAEREQEAHHVWSGVRRRVDDAAEVAAAGFGPLAAGPAGFGVSMADGAEAVGMLGAQLGQVRAVGSGILAAGLMCQLANGELSQAEQRAAVADLEELLSEFGENPVFFAGLMGDEAGVSAFYAFLDKAAQPDSAWAGVAAGFAGAARTALPKWTGPLDPTERREVGARLITAAGAEFPGSRGVFMGYLLSGGIDGQVAYGAAVAMDEQVAARHFGGVWDSTSPLAMELVGLHARDPLAAYSVTHAVFDSLSTDPKMSLEFLAPAQDRELGTERVERWTHGGLHPQDLTNMFSVDGGHSLFHTMHAATAYGSASGDLEEGKRAAWLMLDVTHALNRGDGGLDFKSQLSDLGAVELVGAYAPYMDGIGEAITGRSNLEIGADGLAEKYYRGGFDNEGLGLSPEPMPGFRRDEILQVVKGTGLDSRGAQAWQYVTLEHMRCAGEVAAVLDNPANRQRALTTAVGNVARIQGEIDEAVLEEAAGLDTRNSKALTGTVGVGAGFVSGGPVVGSVVGMAASEGADWMAAKLFHAEADALAKIKASYDEDAEAMIHAFYLGVEERGFVGSEVDFDRFLDERLGYSRDAKLSPSEEVIHNIKTEMESARAK